MRIFGRIVFEDFFVALPAVSLPKNPQIKSAPKSAHKNPSTIRTKTRTKNSCTKMSRKKIRAKIRTKKTAHKNPHGVATQRGFLTTSPNSRLHHDPG